MLTIREQLPAQQAGVLEFLGTDLAVSPQNHAQLRDHVHAIKESLYYLESLADLLSQGYGADIPKRDRAVLRLREVAACLQNASLPALTSIETARDAIGKQLKPTKTEGAAT
jgi:hypothetical protein